MLLEELSEKVTLLEQRLFELQNGIPLDGQFIADYFSHNVTPGQEALVGTLDSLNNIAINNGIAQIMTTMTLQGTLKSATFPIQIDHPGSLQLIPIKEDVKCQVEFGPNSVVAKKEEASVGFSWAVGNRSLPSIEVVDAVSVELGENHGVHLKETVVSRQIIEEATFEFGTMGNMWFLARPNIMWQVNNPNGNASNYSSGNFLQCNAVIPTVPFSGYATPISGNFCMDRVGLILSESNDGNTFKIEAEVSALPGNPIMMGIALQMKDVLNGYLGMLENDEMGSYVRLYKVHNGIVSKIAESTYTGSFLADTTYTVAGEIKNNLLRIYVNNSLSLQHILLSEQLVSKRGEYGIACFAPQTMQCSKAKVFKEIVQASVAEQGEIVSDSLTIPELANWLNVAVEANILQGYVEIDYSTDDGENYIAVPAGRIDYPNPSTTKILLSSIAALQNKNTLRFRLRLYNTGTTGWIKALKVAYQVQERPAVELQGVEVIGDVFRLSPNSGFVGTITMRESFHPQQIYRWESLIDSSYLGVQRLEQVVLNSQATVEVDSSSEGHGKEYLLDSDLSTYWESLRSRESWMCFNFQNEVELSGFRWVKKSVTDGSTFYRLQVYNEMENIFENIHSYGFEVNADVTHVLSTPVRGTRFRIWIDCVQPVSFGNARYIELYGRKIEGETGIKYEFSQDDGATFLPLPDNRSLTSLLPEKPIKLRATLMRDNLDCDMYVRSFGFRFCGRDNRGNQVSNIQYDIKIGDELLSNVLPYAVINISHLRGKTIKLIAKFEGSLDQISSDVFPTLSGYKMFLASSYYQSQLDELKRHLHGVILETGRMPDETSLCDAIRHLIRHEIKNSTLEPVNRGGLSKEVSRLRSKIALGDFADVAEGVAPSYNIFNVNETE